MNKSKRIDNPWIKMVKCVGDMAQDEIKVLCEQTRELTHYFLHYV